MRKKICITICLLAGIIWISFAGNASSQNSKEQEALQQHIDIVKTSNPQMYQSMVDAAGGIIVNCMSCHHDIFKDTGSSGKRRPQ